MTSCSNSAAMSCAVSKSRTSLTVAIWPMPMSVLITCADFTAIACARLATVIVSSTGMRRLIAFACGLGVFGVPLDLLRRRRE